jgi:predicted ATP-dependent endonuclease of OLD family
MRLKEVRIHNFRGYSQKTTIPIDQCITGFIGKNDAGKSSILEALGIFFNSDTISLDKDDFNVSDAGCLIEISCVFDNLPDEIVIDESNSTTFCDEYLLNNDNELEIIKIYKRTQPKAPQVYIRANHPTASGYDEIHKLDLKGLKAKVKELLIDEASITDKRKCTAWRKAIWSNSTDLNVQMTDLDISAFAGDSKKMQEKIQKLLPLYQLFKVDRETKDNDPVAKSPLQNAVDLAKEEFADRISTLEEEIKAKVIERAHATLEKLKEMDEALASSLIPKFKTPPKWAFDFSLDGDDNIPINKRGSGVRRLILLNFFRAEAERKIASENAPSVIYAFEEPETSQHPNNQEMLMGAFIQIAQKSNSQVLLTTHVPSLGSMLPTSGIRYVENVGNVTTVIYNQADMIRIVADSLGILPEPIPNGAKAIILVEGPYDIVFLKHAANLLKQNGDIAHTFEEKQIAILIAGGCSTVKHWLTMNIVEQFNKPWGLFLDSDISNQSNNIQNTGYVSDLATRGIKAHLTKKNEIENYIDESIIGLPAGTINITDTSDAKKDIARALHIRETKVIGQLWPLMTYPLLKSREKYIAPDGSIHYEITEIINDFLSLVP